MQQLVLLNGPTGRLCSSGPVGSVRVHGHVYLDYLQPETDAQSWECKKRGTINSSLL